MATKLEELENTQSCFSKAALDEPIFVLRAQDMFAPAAVEAWVQAAWQHYTVELETLPPSLEEKLEEAEALARLMREWPTRKVPD